MRAPERWIAPAAGFCLTALMLVAVRQASPLPVLLADRVLPGWGWMEIAALSGYAAAVIRIMLDPGRSESVRSTIWSLFSAAFFLQLVLGLSGAELFLMSGELHLPVPALIVAGPIYRGEGLFMPLLFLATVALVGPAWCSHLCYLGAWEDRLSRRAEKAPVQLPKWATHGVRAAILGLAVVLPLVFRAYGVPSVIAVFAGLGFGIVGLGVMLTLARRFSTMVHCTVICPIGLVADVLGRLSPWRIRIGEGCTGCGACARACRYSALGRRDLAKGRPGLTCTLCGDCVARCPEKAIGYHFPRLSQKTARIGFVCLVVSLHAVFLGLARI